MPSPSQVTVTYLIYSSANPAVITTASVAIAMPSSLTGIDSGQTGASQTGFNALDVLLSNISKRFGITFFDASNVQHFIPLSNIVDIKGA
ncbi:MAG TPA: hypothetical protein VGI46_06845 [Candidatus Acidoferrum sp.]